MAAGNFFNPPLRHVTRITSSGTFIIPSTISKMFVTVTGARGGQSGNGSQPGASISQGGYVEVLPGSTVSITIGAGGTSGGSSGTTGGTTSFDGALTVTGSTGGSQDPRYGGTFTGSSGSRTVETSLPTGNPSGALARVAGSSTDGPHASQGVGAAGFINIYA
jgi:hypothetical protein